LDEIPEARFTRIDAGLLLTLQRYGLQSVAVGLALVGLKEALGFAGIIGRVRADAGRGPNAENARALIALRPA